MKNNKRFTEYLNAPVTRKERITGTIISIFGGFWVGFFISIYFYEVGTSFTTIGIHGLYGAIIFGILGFLFPRVMKIIMFPFSIMGIS